MRAQDAAPVDLLDMTILSTTGQATGNIFSGANLFDPRGDRPPCRPLLDPTHLPRFRRLFLPSSAATVAGGEWEGGLEL